MSLPRQIVGRLLVSWLLCVLAPTAVFACSEVEILNPGPTVSQSDCSFHSAGVNDYYSGNAAIDVGNEKIAQLIVSSPSCPFLEQLLFVECATLETITIDGVYEPKVQEDILAGEYIMIGGELKIRYIQPPYGPISISRSATVTSLARLASRYNLITTRDLPDQISRFPAADRFDPYCGCKRFYPSSAGARK